MKQKPEERKEGERGYALLVVFLLAAGIAVSLYIELPRVAFETQRNRELLTMDRAQEYQRAIQLFVRANKRYPSKIEDLESFNDKRVLRHRFIDPLTGKDDWRFVHVAPNGMLTDSLVKKNSNPLGPNDDKNKDQLASNTDPNANGTDPNAPTGGPLNMAKVLRPSDTMVKGMPPMGGAGAPPPGSDPSLQQPQYPAQPQYPGQPVPGQPLPGQPFPGQYPGQPGQPFPAPPGQPVPGQPYPGQPMPGQPMPGQPFPIPQPGQPVTPSQLPFPAMPGQQPQQQTPQPIPGQNYPGSVPTSVIQSIYNPTAPPPGVFPNPQPGAGTAGATAATGGTFGAPGGSAFQNQPGGGMGGGIAGVGIPAEMKGSGIMVVKDRTKYKEWEFIYDPKEDKNIVGSAGAAMNATGAAGMGNNNPLGASPTGAPTPQPNPNPNP